MYLLRATTLSYLHIGNDLGTYRFLLTLTVECGNTHGVNPLYIYDPQQAKSIFAIVPWQLDSSKNIVGVENPCLVVPAPPCYSVFYYHADTVLPGNLFGYTAAVVNCCRPGYVNIVTDTSNIFRTEDPPTTGQNNGFCTPEPGVDFAYNGISSFVRIRPFRTFTDINSSPQFVSKDTILFVCKDSLFSNQVSAIDPDGDSVAYHISRPTSINLTWICGVNSCTYTMQPRPPEPQLDFSAGYSVTQPAGPGFLLDPATGRLRGSIHDTGTYVVPVSALEYRNGTLLDSVTKEIMIRVFDCHSLPPPKAIVPPLLNDCNDFTVPFPNYSTPDYHGYNWLRTFQWNFGDGDSSSAVNPSHTYADTGVYHVRLVIFPGLYCADTAYSKVLIYPKVLAAFTHEDSCIADVIQFKDQSVSTSGAIDSTSWKIFLGDQQIDSALTVNLRYSFPKAPQTYAVVLRIVNSEGCATSDTQTVSIYPSPSLLASHDTILARGATLTLHAVDGNFGTGATFTWTPTTGLSDPAISDPVLNSEREGTWRVTITNVYGCTLTDSIHVKYYAGPEIYVPNAFTPNGDGKNDVLRPVAPGIAASFHFQVYSRSGQLVFQTANRSLGWDGRIGGQSAPTGTYVWEASGIDYRGKFLVRKGTVELLR